MKKNPRSLDCSRSSDVSDTSLNGKLQEANDGKQFQSNHGGICQQSYEGYVKVVQPRNQEIILTRDVKWSD